MKIPTFIRNLIESQIFRMTSSIKLLFRSLLSILAPALISLTVHAQDSLPKWMRYPAISPDGLTIVFSYKGDLYTVPSSGGKASVLTLHEAHDFKPVWSPDSKQIAFASDRYGNYDIFVIPAEGGSPKRLTWHSANDYPSDFSPDGKRMVTASPDRTARIWDVQSGAPRSVRRARSP